MLPYHTHIYRRSSHSDTQQIYHVWSPFTPFYPFPIYVKQPFTEAADNCRSVVQEMQWSRSKHMPQRCLNRLLQTGGDDINPYFNNTYKLKNHTRTKQVNNAVDLASVAITTHLSLVYNSAVLFSMPSNLLGRQRQPAASPRCLFPKLLQ